MEDVECLTAEPDPRRADEIDAQAELKVAKAALQSLSGELEQSKKLVAGMVSMDDVREVTRRLEASEQQVRKLTEELDQQRVETSQLLEQGKLADRQGLAEIDRLKTLMEGMVERLELDKSHAESKRLAGEVERLRKELEGMVPKAQLDTASDALRSAQAEVGRVQKLMEESVAGKAELNKSQAESKRLASEVERLRKELEGMVPKAQLDTASDALR